ncbi:thyroid receptor-interacting protein 11-like isoform X1 [Ostrinia furnacalis]|uniref:thyroid receptor-interacting protein 11-like isoform X1 n=2 Tax=Ostrinia furnacalis TaxID=93504 RepID=UPI00103A007F|nr:thyroid receptor-interacting protein 11-like isoform X1 [Ostrinia furnacalis]
MSWLNLNQSLSSLKGQITNFATEVLSEPSAESSSDLTASSGSLVKELEDKCHNQELEIAALKKLTEELQASLQSEKFSRKNGVKEDESSWYWDPPPQTKPLDHELENQYQVQIQTLQNELSTMRERDTFDHKPEEEELHRLREENKNLTTNLEDLDSQHQMAMERLLSLKKELQKNFEVLKQEHEDLKSSNDEYALELKTLLLKLGERDKEIESLKTVKSDFDTLHHKYQNLEKIHSLLRENAEKFQEENQDLHEEVFKLQEQVTKLEHDVEIATKNTELSNMVPRERYDELMKELNDLKSRRNSNQIHLDEINIDDNAKSVIENLKREISELKHKLAHRHESQDNSDNKTIKPERIIQLYNKYVNFELPVDLVGEIPAPGDNVVMYKLESVFKTVHSFKKDIDTLEHKLSEKNLNISHLQTQVDDLATENDYLHGDVKHFEREFIEAKKNNDFLLTEIAVLKNTSKLEPISETHEDNYAKLETELADCNKMNKTFESEIKRIENELNEVMTEKVVLQESLSDLRNKYTTMLNELDMCRTRGKEVEELEHNANVEQKKQLEETTDEVDELKKRLSAVNAKNVELAIDFHIIENDKVLLTKEVDELRNALKEKSNEHKELEVMKVTLDHKLEDLENKLDEVIKHKNEIEDDKIKLEEQVKILEKEIEMFNQTTTKEVLDKLELEKNKTNTLQHENSMLLESVEQRKSELNNLRRHQVKLESENESLKNINRSNTSSAVLLQQTLEELKAKTVQEEVLNNEILALKEENKNLTERKLQIEAELSSTDSKIVRLEEEFDKLIADLNEKDTLIDNLNATVEANNVTLQNLNQNVVDLENSVAVKNGEIEHLNAALNTTQQNLNEANKLAANASEELKKLQSEKEEISKQLYSLNDEIATKNSQISNLTSRLEELEKNGTDYNQLLVTKDKEIKELNQSIVEAADKLKVTENVSLQNDEYARLVQEKETIEKEVSELRNAVVTKDNEIRELNGKCEQLEKVCVEYKTAIDNATTERTELINLLNLKHNESMQYHGEIQRLNHVILEHTNEFKRVIEEKDRMMQNNSECCSDCEKLRITLKEKDEIIMNLTHNSSDQEGLRTELLNASESIKVLTEKCNNLDKSLAIQLETVKRLTAENVQLSEQEQNSSRELERLRRHLVETEESYTQELMTAEQKLTECQTRLHQIEERAKQNTTVYTSNSIRANQEVETLRTQIKLLEKQREEVQARLSEAEDARSRSEVALTNLQVVLEQFQLDKERDIHAATEKIRNKMEDLKRENHGLQDEIARLNSRLEEALAGLQAASRLGDQVETKTAQINDLKEQVRTLQTSVAAAEERYYNAISNQQDKVDKNLVKNLVINYVMTTNSSNNKTQVLRILSTVLDFNQQECEKLGLVKSVNATDSLAAEFVKFLQNESRPRAALPNMMGIAQSSSRSTTPTSRRSSTLGPNPTPQELGHKRNPSTGSNNLLFQNIDAIETSSTLSVDSDHRDPRVVTQMDTGVNQTRNTEGAILKHVLKDM